MLSHRDLVLKTASHIENNPQSYCYTINQIPRYASDRGCILGWMAHFSAMYDDDILTPEIIARTTCDPVYTCDVFYNDFFRRLDECYPIYRGHWRSDAEHAVAALRAYASQYPEAPALPPWAKMRDREAAAAQESYRRFRAGIPLYPRLSPDEEPEQVYEELSEAGGHSAT